MTTTASEQRRGGWLVLLLAAVLTFTTMVLLGATAGAGVASAATVSTGGGSSASSVPASQTRVGVSTSDSILVVGAHDSIAAGQGRGNLSSQSCFVSGCCVAAEDGAPQAAKDALNEIDKGKWPPAGNPGMKGGGAWKNLGNPLPTTDGAGNPITYREWDVNPPGPTGRDAVRIITGSDGSAWYTDDHYSTFTRIR